MDGRHYAHLNRGYLKAPFGDPAVAEFEAALAQVNAVAARSPGFIANLGVNARLAQRLFYPAGGVTGRVAATLSVWEDPHLLRHFVHDTLHGRFLARRAAWFVPMEGPAYVIWPIAPGHRPDLFEAQRAWVRLRDTGPGPDAFDFPWLDTVPRASA
jgi:hypothetical protein